MSIFRLFRFWVAGLFVFVFLVFPEKGGAGEPPCPGMEIPPSIEQREAVFLRHRQKISWNAYDDFLRDPEIRTAFPEMHRKIDRLRDQWNLGVLSRDRYDWPLVLIVNYELYRLSRLNPGSAFAEDSDKFLWSLATAFYTITYDAIYFLAPRKKLKEDLIRLTTELIFNSNEASEDRPLVEAILKKFVGRSWHLGSEIEEFLQKEVFQWVPSP